MHFIDNRIMMWQKDGDSGALGAFRYLIEAAMVALVVVSGDQLVRTGRLAGIARQLQCRYIHGQLRDPDYYFR